jgi:hypothetical protein
MADTLLTPTVIAKESLRILTNNLVAGSLVHREYKNEFVKVGNTLTIRKPVKFAASDGATRVNQDVTENSTSIVVNKRKHVSWDFSSSDLTLTIEKYSERYIQPAMEVLADQVDVDLLAEAVNVHNAVGTPGTTPNAYSILGDAAAKLDNEAAPSMNRSTVFNPAANWATADALKGLLNPSMNQDFVRKGSLGRIANSEVYSTQNVSRITTGARGGTPLVNGGSQTGSSLVTDGWSNSITGVVKAGDIITLGSTPANTVYAVNPVNKQSTGQARQFVVTADANSNGSGQATISISPAITTSTAYQTVNASPADNLPIALMGSASTAYPANLMFHRDAFALVMCPLELPKGAAFKARASAHGVSVRIINDYDVDDDLDIIRLDILYGTKTLYPELACRIFG